LAMSGVGMATEVGKTKIRLKTLPIQSQQPFSTRSPPRDTMSLPHKHPEQ
jgi:hypothetical protein